MSHFPKPFFKKARGLWYVEINRQQFNLGSDRDAAFRQYHQLMMQPTEKVVSTEMLAGVIDAFLEWLQKNRAADTYEWYRYRLQRCGSSVLPPLPLRAIQHAARLLFLVPSV